MAKIITKATGSSNRVLRVSLIVQYSDIVYRDENTTSRTVYHLSDRAPTQNGLESCGQWWACSSPWQELAELVSKTVLGPRRDCRAEKP